MTSTTGLSRVTIVAPRTRVDVALPSEVPLADVLPTLLRFAGERLADDPDGRHGWSLARLAGAPLDIARTPLQLEIRDGDMLYLRPRGAAAPEPVFDDVVDAVATATQTRPGRWIAANTRRFGVGLGAFALVAGAIAVLFAGPPHLPGALVALLLTVALLGCAVVAARAFDDRATGILLALVAMAYAFVGGLLVFAGERPVDDLSGANLLVAATAVLLVSALGSVMIATASHVFLGTGIAASALALGAAISLLTGAAAASAASIVVGFALLAMPALPMFSYRLAGLPVPSVPTGTEDVRSDAETVDGARVLAMAERADNFLSAMLAALAAVAAGTAVTLAVAESTPSLVLCGLLGLLMLSRARWFISTGQRLPLLAAGVIGVAALEIALFARGDVLVRLAVVVVALLVVAGVSIGYALRDTGRRASPMWGRTLDIIEIMMVLSVLPLIVWVSGLYGWIRTFRDS
ncbi:type VII secretion integral membrane protein EccD [Virgisporangium aliadipatigenens]|uniref:Type VII secretion integral membrane protein EccD n=1 Tax=Virgisporangium aliadipatigenens TaxID=741659 RepID=A0A8J3YTX5_9ACTN|nr:type VII secretion integral membrane protein EccD [Virgisporangium aliadipatigenens]GIJ49688.1 type VII secretion integral membrane protein EccD [Virgisporangium aliadipatigenens]